MTVTVTQVVDGSARPAVFEYGDFLTLNDKASSQVKRSYRKLNGSSQPSMIEKGPLRIVITDSPSDFTIEQHLSELMKFNVKHVCRACEPSYSTSALTQAGIKVHDFAFPDGDPPSDIIISQWLDTIEECFISGPNILKATDRISVHCVAGLGRAPVLVAVALVEFCNMEPLEAVEFIRKHRRGAINKKQLNWLEDYVPRRAKHKCANCLIC
mmetsp:Transcript_15796/g.17830  ORF Transcript_15796/g.17830 Transcript_15796/m.17830 type:complete len:212 (-) Transcript_15796:63-698(-)|eukprot:CAMPEP_0184005318 /NCGR_PEP_ID=MMETSP0954-20121128/1_1 /TAXON_ID=627963 /ORGANISM="Aplanochytrium sp, Strain PBS07" /LENGTH=211 /DNA_ID=CAMNT_0026283603 /DNA_START=788 /DNA_END=1423 /DNA_ORIENTATION=+